MPEEDPLKDEYVRELRSIVWNKERIEALEFLTRVKQDELAKTAAKTVAYKRILFRLIVKLMRLTG